MGLETATFVSQLVNTNPVVGDAVKEGDDHLRLLKAVLQATFPNAAKALYFPSSVAEVAGNISPAAADAGKVYPVNASAAPRTVSLPTAPPDGYEVTVIKTDSSANAVTIAPPGGVLINGVTTITIDLQFESARCIYLSTFAGWLAMRSPKADPFGLDQVLGLTNGGTGATTGYAAFDALSAARVDVASAATTNLDTAQSSYVRITGTTGITAITLAAGRKRWVVFEGAVALTHGASLLLPGAANITTVAGDMMLLLGESGGVVRCLQYLRNLIPWQVPARAYAEVTASAVTSSAIPADGTVPLVTEGDEFTSAAITLKRADSRVRARFSSCVQTLEGRTGVAVMFRGSTCLIARGFGGQTGVEASWTGNFGVELAVEDAPGSVGPHTYTVRIGMNGASVTFNPLDYGAATKSILTLEEVFV